MVDPASTSHAPGPPGAASDPFEHPESPGHYGRLSVIETAAERGVGPLSERGRYVWHGDARPCVSCGELIPRSAERCELCGQDLSPAMLERMRSAAGPWYVMEHIRPFPGVTLERLIRQAKRGVLTQTTVVRGPTTDHQWCFAAETPGLSQYLGCCWNCHADVGEDDLLCRNCGADLLPTYDTLSPSRQDLAPTRAAAPPPELAALSEAVSEAESDLRAEPVDETPRVGSLRAAWIALGLLALLVAGVLWLVKLRTRIHPPAGPIPLTPALVPHATRPVG